MSEVAHLRIQLNNKKSELELLKKNGSGKRPTKKPSVNPDGNSTGGRQKGRVRGKRDTSGGIH